MCRQAQEKKRRHSQIHIIRYYVKSNRSFLFVLRHPTGRYEYRRYGVPRIYIITLCKLFFLIHKKDLGAPPYRFFYSFGKSGLCKSALFNFSMRILFSQSRYLPPIIYVSKAMWKHSICVSTAMWKHSYHVYNNISLSSIECLGGEYISFYSAQKSTCFGVQGCGFSDTFSRPPCRLHSNCTPWMCSRALKVLKSPPLHTRTC